MRTQKILNFTWIALQEDIILYRCSSNFIIIFGFLEYSECTVQP